jgi:hypothetical protein
LEGNGRGLVWGTIMAGAIKEKTRLKSAILTISQGRNMKPESPEQEEEIQLFVERRLVFQAGFDDPSYSSRLLHLSLKYFKCVKCCGLTAVRG